MTHYHLTHLATRKCEHGQNTVCTCERKPVSAAVQAYLDKAKSRLREGILYNPEWKPEHSNNRYRWIEHPTRGLRLKGSAHELARAEGQRLDHTGYYTDSFQSETVHGEVYQLPGKDGEPRYVPAVNDPNNDGAILDFHSVTSDLMDAVRWSDSMAEYYAEDCREGEAKDTAEQRVSEIKAEIEDTIAEVRALCTELRANCDKLTGLDKVKAAIRAEVLGARRKIHALRKEQRKIEDNYWEAVPTW